MVTPGQDVFERYIIFNLASLVDWRVVTAVNQQQVDIDNAPQKASRDTLDYAIGD